MSENVKDEYHVHIDATYMPDDVYRFAKSLGFFDHHFSGHPDGYQHFEPDKHLTHKPRSKKEFRNVWSQIVKKIPGTQFIGYLEGEFIKSWVPILWQPYKDIIGRKQQRSLGDF